MLLVSCLFIYAEETAHQVSLGGNILCSKHSKTCQQTKFLSSAICHLVLFMGIFFHKFHFAGTVHWMKKEYIKQVLK
jgi:hypothetical protein